MHTHKEVLGSTTKPGVVKQRESKKYKTVCRINLTWNARRMTLLAFILLLSFLPAESAKSRYPPKASLNPVFGPQQVYGLIDGSVSIKCFYPSTTVNRHDRKYWCKESSRSCLTVISTSGYTARGYQGRVTIADFPEQGIMLVNVSQLALADQGTYQCGIGLNGKGLSNKVKLDVSEGPDIPEEAELFYVELQGSVSMACDFGGDYASTRKFFCKMEKSGCRNIVDTYGKIDPDFQGRVLLSNDNTEGAFSIMITQVGWEDAGLYLCGVGSYGEYGKTKELSVHVYEGTKAPQEKDTVFGIKGSSATIDCNYDPTKNYTLKYLCKWRTTGCARIIDNTGFLSIPYEGRVAMFDNPKNGTFSIILNQLRSSDEGFYWCMTNDHRERKTSKELKIIEGEPGLTGKEEVQAEVGSRVDLTCSYSCKYYSYEKYWCKWSSDGCTPLTASDQSQPGLDVSCDTANKTLILSLDPVTVEDQGWYWCGVRRNGHYGETMAVSLQVDGGEAVNISPELLDLEASNTAAPAGAVPQGRANSDAGVQRAAASESSEQSSGPNTLALILGPVSAALLVLATAFAVFKYRQIKRSDLVSVGSYRTNISMSDFENAKEYGANDNVCMRQSQETQLGGDEFVTTTASIESTAETKKAKRGSKEDADLAYSASLLTPSTVTQSSVGDSTAPAEAPPLWGGSM
ncbi:polymeric immunoglobulin receptor [Meleagris gallopavo]|uniref:Polymeric immunoglobulin receptor n=1 Tax=Meleagris gallopavo TaxID=9103 RepID=G3UTW1_MELGA|nr:polymeric immunoglobulin receptor [Meleagris gallopavo]